VLIRMASFALGIGFREIQKSQRLEIFGDVLGSSVNSAISGILAEGPSMSHAPVPAFGTWDSETLHGHGKMRRFRFRT